MTSSSSDGPEISKHHTTKAQRKTLADRMKRPDDPLKLVIVRDMWLTGFDAQSLHTLYIDKPMKGHNLMQAIARVNRVYKDKPGGLIVDYLGIASDLKKALSFYSDAGGKGAKPVSHISRTITNLSGSSGCFILSAKVFLCALVVWCLEISGPSDELEVITTLITPLSRSSECQSVRIYYESRLAKVNLSEEGKQLVEKLDDELAQDDLTETQKAKAKWTQLEALIGSENRIKNIAQDIVSHFEQRQAVFEGKGMIVSMSRRIAADLYAQIIKIKPDWHSDDLDKGVFQPVVCLFRLNSL
jgi:type I site-specific restriction-modification system R (restriction) subunit